MLSKVRNNTRVWNTERNGVALIRNSEARELHKKKYDSGSIK
jgi:hypothetical protein